MAWYLATTLGMAIFAAIVFCYYLNKGQFDDAEEAKYLLFRDEEDRHDVDN